MIEKLLNNPPLWTRGRKFSEIVVFSKVILKRNIKGFKFTTKATNEEKEDVFSFISEALKKEYKIFNLSTIDKDFLSEREIIPKTCRPEKSIGFGFDSNENFSLLINDEDHLKLQYIEGGFAINNCYKNIDEIDNKFGKLLPYAFSSEFGFLTVSPKDVGTGLKIYVVMHLPCLVHFGKIKKIVEKLEEENLIVEPFYGERTHAEGNFLQISNRITIGKKEEEIIDQLNKIVTYLIETEISIRDSLLKTAKKQLEDKIFRSYAILKNARLLSFDEFVNLSSAVRLGVGLNILGDVKIETLNKLLIFTQPAHIKKYFSLKEVNTEILDEKRAIFVKETL